ncbi:hypothetical protein [Peribacillus deserti]|uniref:Uncharacterized protein n=1 Tax=Peribacillus deserti TaxID=673318 RepID=A0A2N5M8I1_9BACI|nr:hypothetical protein [Peribacillus deserti]PLT30642.1 hypothetical protein CUU66_06725 [Peribacillus deserti]
MDYDFYNNPDNWIGGFYELSIEYHPFGNNKRVNEALTALCKSDYFNGFWEDKKDYQKKSISLPINIEEDSVTQFYGTLSLSNSKEGELPCVITVIRVDGESDWLDIAIPQAALEKRFPYKYPLTIELNPWLKKINARYTQLAEIIYCSSPFDLAMIGEEITGYTNQEEITYEVVQNIICILPSHLQDRLGLKGKGLSNQLIIFD